MRTLKPTPPPKLTKSPWAGYTSHEHKRAEPLTKCPSARCQRVKACVAAHEELYCQRTHISHAAHRARLPKRKVILDLELRRETMVAELETKLEKQKLMLQSWKAGEFDHLYGKYKASGVIMQPPSRHFLA